ncbi:MAG TPA: peptidyl-prolyl cis-trans isomerase, partial [Salinimicrobium catena]|nr:peptidyl-prolyl cis-trans isomerase [Salinimicrobium catena]
MRILIFAYSLIQKELLIKFFRFTIAAFIGLFFTGCDLFEKTEEKVAIARVNDSYLYPEDVASLISENTSPQDSALIVSSYINRWATQKLLIDRAKVNLSERQQREFDQLVQNYKNELYAKAYTDVIVGRELDTAVRMEEAREYYEKNGENFLLNENLLKLRYINLGKNHQDFDLIKTRFRRFDEEDKEALLDMAIQFNSYSLNDSVWV